MCVGVGGLSLIAVASKLLELCFVWFWYMRVCFCCACVLGIVHHGLLYEFRLSLMLRGFY